MLPLDIFSNEWELPTSSITEIPMDKLDILINQMSIIIKDSKEEKTFMFDTSDIETFIENSVKYIIKDIQMLDIKPNK